VRKPKAFTEIGKPSNLRVKPLNPEFLGSGPVVKPVFVDTTAVDGYDYLNPRVVLPPMAAPMQVDFNEPNDPEDDRRTQPVFRENSVFKNSKNAEIDLPPIENFGNDNAFYDELAEENALNVIKSKASLKFGDMLKVGTLAPPPAGLTANDRVHKVELGKLSIPKMQPKPALDDEMKRREALKRRNEELMAKAPPEIREMMQRKANAALLRKEKNDPFKMNSEPKAEEPERIHAAEPKSEPKNFSAEPKNSLAPEQKPAAVSVPLLQSSAAMKKLLFSTDQVPQKRRILPSPKQPVNPTTPANENSVKSNKVVMINAERANSGKAVDPLHATSPITFEEMKSKEERDKKLLQEMKRKQQTTTPSPKVFRLPEDIIPPNPVVPEEKVPTKQKLTIKTVEPVVAKVEPVTKTVEPVVVKVEQVKVEPVTKTVEPVAVEIELVKVEIEPEIVITDTESDIAESAPPSPPLHTVSPTHEQEEENHLHVSSQSAKTVLDTEFDLLVNEVESPSSQRCAALDVLICCDDQCEEKPIAMLSENSENTLSVPLENVTHVSPSIALIRQIFMDALPAQEIFESESMVIVKEPETEVHASLEDVHIDPVETLCVVVEEEEEVEEAVQTQDDDGVRIVDLSVLNEKHTVPKKHKKKRSSSSPKEKVEKNAPFHVVKCNENNEPLDNEDESSGRPNTVSETRSSPERDEEFSVETKNSVPEFEIEKVILSNAKDLSHETVKSLRDMCKERNLCVKGNKQELIRKLTKLIS
jgi:hypothetical protein